MLAHARCQGINTLIVTFASIFQIWSLAQSDANEMSGLMVAIPEVSAYLPGPPVDNEWFEPYGIDESWVSTRTGINTRHFSAAGVTASDLAVIAAERLTVEGRSAVDCVINTTATPDYISPSTAGVIAAKLGLSGRGVAAFDVSAACSGFVYGLAVAKALVDSLGYHVLLTSAESSSLFVDPADKATGPIFGDGAAALLLTPTAAAPDYEVVVDGIHLGANGEDVGLVRIPGGAGDARARAVAAASEETAVPTLIRMDGRALFLQACEKMSAAALRSIELTGITAKDVALVIPHQANARIIDSVAHITGIPRTQFFDNIGSVGNTISASIPIALAEAITTGRIAPGANVVVSAFGGGTSWGAATLRWTKSLPTASLRKGDR